MGRGRPRKPDVLKKLEGNPGKRALGEDVLSTGGHPSRPVYVTGYAAEVWDEITCSMPAGLYSATDGIALASFCVAAEQFRNATEELKRDGLTIEAGDGSIKAHPAAVIQARAISTIALMGSRLGCDPVSRASMHMPKVKKEASKFEGLMNMQMAIVPEPPPKDSRAIA